MRLRSVAVLAAVCVLVFGAVWASVVLAVVPATPAPVVWEDEPGWDCATMGNRVCGPVGVAWEGVAQDDYATCAYWDGWSEPACVVASYRIGNETLQDTMARLGY